MSRRLRLLIVVVVLAVIYWLLYESEPSKETIERELEALRDKRVLITGASSGIGEVLAYVYSTYGATVMLTARRGDLLEMVADKCRDLGAKRVEYVAADMSSSEDRRKVVNETKKHFGGRLDHLILNHALMPVGRWTGTAGNMTDFRKVMDVNFVSFVDVASMCLDMLRATRGNIGVVSSVAGKMATPFSSTYTASKFALQGFFGSLRQELKRTNDDVSITLFVLGLINTEMAQETMAKHFSQTTGTIMDTTAEDVSSTAHVILRGVVSRTYEVHHPYLAWIFVQAHNFMPELLEDELGRRSHADFIN